MNNENNNNTAQPTFPDAVIVGGNNHARTLTLTGGTSYNISDCLKGPSTLLITGGQFVGDINYDPTYYMRDHDQSPDILLSGNIPNPA